MTTEITASEDVPELVITREFDATPQEVFRAMTDPDLYVQWMGPRKYEIRLERFEPHHGGAYRFVHVDPDGAEYAFRGVFHTVEAPSTIIQTFEFEGASGEVTLERLHLQDLGGRTRMEGRTMFPSNEARAGALASGMEYGIRESYERLSELLERTSA